MKQLFRTAFLTPEHIAGKDPLVIRVRCQVHMTIHQTRQNDTSRCIEPRDAGPDHLCLVFARIADPAVFDVEQSLRIGFVRAYPHQSVFYGNLSHMILLRSASVV
ncbi:hypothetical protein AK37_11306 [Rhodococcus pyridinivorans AK37]|uniref:Uncharacterized protein n=1 Tax=Rhodococcus pyridinivorans AK37 TaxID=1114960 RepID=H0JRH2_9NOCA|nr:hypothetical protein AK37_11306 [Rhodococcus pyridinivorans AK37]